MPHSDIGTFQCRFTTFNNVFHAIQPRPNDRNVSLSFHCFKNPALFHLSQFSDWNVSLSLRCFQNLTVPMQSMQSKERVPLSADLH